MLTKTQIEIDQLEAIQRRALRIIYSYTNDMPYINALYCTAIPSLADCREQLLRKFFKLVQEPSSCLSSLLPNPRDPSITTRLRFANKFPRLPSRTTSGIYFLCSVSLSDFIAIQPSILVFCLFFNFLHFCLTVVVVYISLFIVLYIALCWFTMCCAIWSYGHKIE